MPESTLSERSRGAGALLADEVLQPAARDKTGEQVAIRRVGDTFGQDVADESLHASRRSAAEVDTHVKPWVALFG